MARPAQTRTGTRDDRSLRIESLFSGCGGLGPAKRADATAR